MSDIEQELSPQSITILGSTGSIGQSTLRVLDQNPNRFKVFALTAQSNWKLLLNQCRRYRPDIAVIATEQDANKLRDAIEESGLETEIVVGTAGLCAVAEHADVDVVMAAIVGSAGLPPCYAAANSGKKLLLANKEALVCAGSLLLSAAERSAAAILPIDSEHNALFQCLPAAGDQPWRQRAAGIRKFVLTGSGGPFLGLDPSEMRSISPDQACAHPNWSMGRKISVDSATLMNKGLEYIEARHLFGIEDDQLEIVIHPQSVIHSMVEYVDGSVLAHLGYPDMRTPIAHALAWPDRMDSGTKQINYQDLSGLTFEQPDSDCFPALNLARGAYAMGGMAPIVLNATNEIAVHAFLAGRIGFLGIAELVTRQLDEISDNRTPGSIEEVISMDKFARINANQGLNLQS